MKNKTFAVGDIHGSYKALKQCFERSNFDFENDKLICLGDIVDGYPEVKQCIDELMKVKNLVFLLGNHEEWVLDWMKYGELKDIWTSQGGKKTLESFGYIDKKRSFPDSYKGNIQQVQGVWDRIIYAEKPVGLDKYIKFFDNACLYHIENNNLFVHGGIDINQKDIKKQKKETLLWDRKLIQTAWEKSKLKYSKWKVKEYNKVFVGHTTTRIFKKAFEPIVEPVHAKNVIDLDTGAGWGGKLTIMDIDTFEYWQSDYSRELYSGLPIEL